jgi:hypothetical protein
MVPAFAEQLNGLDDDRVLESFDLENRLGGGVLQHLIGDQPGTGRQIGRLGDQRRSRSADAGDGSGAEKIATIVFQVSVPADGFWWGRS